MIKPKLSKLIFNFTNRQKKIMKKIIFNFTNRKTLNQTVDNPVLIYFLQRFQRLPIEERKNKFLFFISAAGESILICYIF